MNRIRVAIPAPPAPDYDVIVEPGALATAADVIRTAAPAARYALISDDTVAGLYGDALVARLRDAGLTADLLTVPAGEREKRRERWAELTDAMLALGIGRDGAVLALGGGVIGDLAGFVAATYMRGIPVVQLPTTLLAMIDASVGGKTGVDTEAGKNLVGAMRQPAAVIADPTVLDTLSDDQLREGFAEAVKHGAIASTDYYAWIEGAADALRGRDADALAQLVRGSVLIKASFVTKDPDENGPRKALNFGHTVAHALESLSAYSLPHGAAVSIGIVAEARLGEDAGITVKGTAAALERTLGALGLPTTPPADTDAAAVVTRARTDKKARGGSIRYTLLARLGEVARGPDGDWSIPLSDDGVRRVLSAWSGDSQTDGDRRAATSPDV